MTMHKALTLARVKRAAERGHRTLDNPGFCVECGNEAEGVEPDARNYECEACGANGVFGAEELFLEMAFDRAR